MFEHLPKVKKDDVKVVRKFYMTMLLASADDCTVRMFAEKKRQEWVMDCVCDELKQANPVLVPAVKAVADAMAIQLRGTVDSEALWRAQLMAIVHVLTVLCLIDRALQAKEKGQR